MSTSLGFTGTGDGGRSAEARIAEHAKAAEARRALAEGDSQYEKAALAMRAMADDGLTQRAIAEQVGCGHNRVGRLLRALDRTRSSETPFGEAYSDENNPKPDDEPTTAPGEDDYTEGERALRGLVLSGETVVANFRDHEALIRWAEAEDVFVRIDRKSAWGNPFVLDDDGDREAVIAAYREHYLPFKPSLQSALHQLRGKVLGCWCAPEPCHGDVLREAASR